MEGFERKLMFGTLQVRYFLKGCLSFLFLCGVRCCLLMLLLYLSPSLAHSHTCMLTKRTNKQAKEILRLIQQYISVMLERRATRDTEK